jgi:hypothetical protein
VWRVLQNRLRLKACKLSIVRHRYQFGRGLGGDGLKRENRNKATKALALRNIVPNATRLICQRTLTGHFVLFQAVGIAVEFCSHIIHAFVLSTEKTRILRATDALINTGSSVSLEVFQVASGSNVHEQ